MSQPYWAVERKRSVVQYLISLREAGREIRAAINSLHMGIPEDAHKIQDNPETWEWLEARHWITLLVEQDRRWIYVTDVESATIE
jgi:hypothetical protein